ncbi:hypothetical protein [Streptomyces roseoviridis]|uniref:Uncharacterized protein n=1 Tax=Streptomyces roseoviridis TaxID=67361 RepID=A0ABV5QYK7_9ACTN
MSTPDEVEPLVVRWDRTVIHPQDPRDDTIVCCLTDDGRPVALLLNDELREALGGLLADPWDQNDPTVEHDLDGTTYRISADTEEHPHA